MGVERPAGVTLTCHNQIPHARGLGSSSAAIVAGILLARVLAGGDGSDEAGLDDAAVLRLAAEIEGHPDNVAPCLLGGFTIAWMGRGGAQAVRREPDPAVQPMIFIPSTRALTAGARAALPDTVPHTDAVFNAARVALLVHALTTDPSRLFEATEDRLHQPYRAPGMPETATLVNLLRQARIPAVVSGAGPSVLALVRPGDEAVEPPDGWCARSLSVSLTGARILVSRHAEGDPVAAGPPS
jgi:homoserine kinase